MRHFLICVLALASMGITSNLQARPNPSRGIGGGGPGGGFRPGGPSRPIARPPRPAPGPRPGTLPSRPGDAGPGMGRPIGGGPGAIRPNPGPGPSRPGGRPGAGEIGEHIGGIPGGHFPGTPGHRPGYPYFHRRELLGDVQRHFHYVPGLGYPFSRDWFGRMGWRYHRWPYWSGVVTGIAITSWLNYPPYGGYGSSTTIVYYPEQAAPPQVYDESVQYVLPIAEQGQNATVLDDTDWLDLGTFGLVPFGQQQLAYGLQLAVARNGIVRGLMWDWSRNSNIEVAGALEANSLRIAWQAQGNPNAPYFETTVDQLTQEESLINVYDPLAHSLVSWQLIQIEASDLPPQG